MAVWETSKSHSGQSGRLDVVSRPIFRSTGFAGPLKRPLLWLNLICLDAPLVAVSWEWLFSRACDVPVPRSATVALFLTAWLIYLADRWFDCLRLKEDVPRSIRQEFCRAHLVWFGSLAAAIGFGDTLLACRALDRTTIAAGAIVAVAGLSYLAVNHARDLVWRVLPLKELCIGFIFAAGTMVPLTSFFLSSTVSVGNFATAFLLFGSVCSLNCISIASWERDLDLAHRKVSIATMYPQVRYWLNPFAGLIIVASIIAVLAHPEIRLIGLAVSSSAMLLRAVSWLPVTGDERTALADLVLLTPLLMVWR